MQYYWDVKVCLGFCILIAVLAPILGLGPQFAYGAEIPKGSTSIDFSKLGPMRPQSVYGLRPGYTDDVSGEVSSEPKEMILIEKPQVLQGPGLHEKIFNSELTNEFIFRYQQQFGRTEQEENYFLLNRDRYSITNEGIIPAEKDERRRKFAEYMMKRLTEYHAENILKTDPQFKKVYELKQRIQNIEVKVTEQTRADMMYSFVGNFFNAKVTHPYVTFLTNVNMDPGMVFPTEPKELFFILRKAVFWNVDAELSYEVYDRAIKGLISQKLSAITTFNVSQTVRFSQGQLDQNREALTLLGLTTSF